MGKAELLESSRNTGIRVYERKAGFFQKHKGMETPPLNQHFKNQQFKIVCFIFVGLFLPMNTATRIRKLVNLSQEDLARFLGISRSHLANLEKGKEGLGLKPELKLIQLTRVLDTLPDLPSDPILNRQWPVASIRKRLTRIQIILTRKEKEYQKQLASWQAGKKKLAFIEAMRREPNFEKLGIAAYLDHLEKVAMTEETSDFEWEKMADLKLEIEWWTYQKTYWASKLEQVS
jgi:transcriptional regulator with XRE-family HTH domain